MAFKSLKSIANLTGKTVLLRVAYDVPLKKKGSAWQVSDDERIIETIPTLKYLLKKKCKIVILSWLGRPNGKVVESFKMDPVARKLAQLIGTRVKKLDDCVGPKVYSVIQNMKRGEIIMLENSRFYAQEEENNKLFSALLVHGIDYIIFDAFAQSHRVHASTVGITKLVPTYAGFLLEKELHELSRVRENPKRPFVLIIGGAKISDKVGLLSELIHKADKILLGGGSANVFLKAAKVKIGKSFAEDTFVDKAKKKKINTIQLAKELLKKFPEKIVLPVDFQAGTKISESSLVETVDLEEGQVIRSNMMFLDIGPKTVAIFMKEIKQAKTIFFNGPMGVFELKKFAFGTKKIIEAVARKKAVTVAGGGDTLAAISKFKAEKGFQHISTGGGASLEFLAGHELPALANIKRK